MSKPKPHAPNWIPVNKPYIAPNAAAYVNDALNSQWLSPGGPMARAFAEKLGEYVGGKAVLVNSGTSALEMAIRAAARVYGKTSGSIIVPTYTCPDCAIAVIKAGFRPVFADIDEQFFSLTATTLEPLLKGVRDVVGVMIVHLYGIAALPSIYDMCRAHGLFIVDDVAEGLGVRPGGHNLLDLTDVAITSLRGEKPLPVGTGGVVMTRHEGIEGLVKSMVGLNSPGAFNRYYTVDMAYSYEFPETLAALGLAQLEVYPQMVQARRQLDAHYQTTIFGETDDSELDDTDVPWKFPVVVDDSREAWAAARQAGVEVSPPHWPLHQLPFLRDCHAKTQAVSKWTLEAAEWAHEHIVAYPLWPGMDDEQIERVVAQIEFSRSK